MSEMFTLEDIFNVMIELETLGSSHYSQMKELTPSAKLKVLFGQLAEAELAHKELYNRFKEEMVLFGHESVDEEYKGYMDALLKQTVRFLDESREAATFEEGFDIAVQLEKDTILLLNELRSLTGPEHHEAIDQVISQEKGHLKALYDYKEMQD